MKNLKASLIFTILFILGFSLSSQAQNLIKPEELNSKLLKETFENLFVDVLETEETYIKIDDYYKYYLDIDADKRYILISSSFKLNDKASKENIMELLNIINRDVVLVRAYTSADYKTITYNYYFWIGGGFTMKSLYESINLMKAAMNLSLEKDTKGVL